MASVSVIPSDSSQSTNVLSLSGQINAHHAEPRPAPTQSVEGDASLAICPSATLNISQKLSHEVEPIIMGDSLNQGTTISCANNYRWKWASGSSLSSSKLCPSIAVNKCLGKLLLNLNN